MLVLHHVVWRWLVVESNTCPTPRCLEGVVVESNTCNITSKVYTHSINGLTNYAKQYLMAAYKIECTIGHCYICQHTLS